MQIRLTEDNFEILFSFFRFKTKKKKIFIFIFYYFFFQVKIAVLALVERLERLGIGIRFSSWDIISVNYVIRFAKTYSIVVGHRGFDPDFGPYTTQLCKTK